MLRSKSSHTLRSSIVEEELLALDEWHALDELELEKAEMNGMLDDGEAMDELELEVVEALLVLVVVLDEGVTVSEESGVEGLEFVVWLGSCSEAEEEMN